MNFYLLDGPACFYLFDKSLEYVADKILRNLPPNRLRTFTELLEELAYEISQRFNEKGNFFWLKRGNVPSLLSNKLTEEVLFFKSFYIRCLRIQKKKTECAQKTSVKFSFEYPRVNQKSDGFLKTLVKLLKIENLLPDKIAVSRTHSGYHFFKMNPYFILLNEKTTETKILVHGFYKLVSQFVHAERPFYVQKIEGIFPFLRLDFFYIKKQISLLPSPFIFVDLLKTLDPETEVYFDPEPYLQLKNLSRLSKLLPLAVKMKK